LPLTVEVRPVLHPGRGLRSGRRWRFGPPTRTATPVPVAIRVVIPVAIAICW